MPGPIIPDRTPSWLKPENASVFDSPWVTAVRKIAHLIGADDPQSQVMALMAPMETGPSGGVAGLLQKVIKAYHGSPHDFERFDLSKIGTGEGAQAYGHGLYFAENPKTAEAYKENLSPRVNSFGGVPVKTPAESMAHYLLSRGPRTLDDALRMVDDWAEQGVFKGENGTKAALDVKRAVAENFGKALDSTRQGRMYEVAIKADPEQFLDWDKQLSQQPTIVEKARDAYDRAVAYRQKINPHLTPKQIDAVMQGGDLVKRLAAEAGEGPDSPVATKYLKERGIPGIKYLDQGSRGLDVDRFSVANVLPDGHVVNSFAVKDRAEADALVKGWAKTMKQLAPAQRGTPRIDVEPAKENLSRNYVVFDDALVEIRKKWAALLAAADAARRGATQSDQQQ